MLIPASIMFHARHSECLVGVLGDTGQLVVAEGEVEVLETLGGGTLEEVVEGTLRG
jgi:hypothetical protein